MKKVGAILLAVALCAAMLCTAIPALAKVTVNDLEVDLSKCVRLKPDDSALTYTPNASGDGSYDISTTSWWATIFFESAESTVIHPETTECWFGSQLIGLKNTQDEYIILNQDYDYSINVVYDLTVVGSPNPGFYPQIALCYNANANPAADNSERLLAAARHGETGTYSLSTQVSGMTRNGYALRLAFGGVSSFRIRSVTVKAVSNSLDLTKIDQFGEKVTGFTPATKQGDPVTITFGAEAIAIDDTTTAKQWLKAMLPLRNSDEEYLRLKEGVTYIFSVDYQVVSGSGQLAFICNDNTSDASMTANNGSRVLTGGQAFANDGGGQKNLTVTYTAKAGDTGRAIRLAFGHWATIQVDAIRVSPCANASLVTLVDGGVSTTDYMVKGDALPQPTPRDASYLFAGWYADSGFDGQPVETAAGEATYYAKWDRTFLKTEIDLSDETLLTGFVNTSVAQGTGTEAPTYEDGALHWVVRDYERQLGDWVPSKTDYTWFPLLTLLQGGKAHSFTKGDKVIVEVGYRVTRVTDTNHGVQIGVGAGGEGVANWVYPIASQRSDETTPDGKTQFFSHVWIVGDATSPDQYTTPKIAVSGGGDIEITSITLYECPQEVIPQHPVATYDDEGQITHGFVMRGGAPKTMDNTAEHNFGGWYKDAAKVEAVTEDVTLTAKWYAKADVNMDDDKDIRDLVFLNDGLADGKSDAVLDYNFNETVDVQELNALRVYLLGLS